MVPIALWSPLSRSLLPRVPVLFLTVATLLLGLELLPLQTRLPLHLRLLGLDGLCSLVWFALVCLLLWSALQRLLLWWASL